MNSILTFENKIQKKKEGICSSDRNYIDFLIDGKSLKEILGDVNSNIGKFGWKTNAEFELKELNELLSLDKSRHNKGLFSIYVCAECGDVECLAIMFEKTTIENEVIWSNFVWSDGYDEIDDSHTKFNTESIIFEKESYNRSLKILEQMINI